jgi:hypothetical protein
MEHKDILSDSEKELEEILYAVDNNRMYAQEAFDKLLSWKNREVEKAVNKYKNANGFCNLLANDIRADERSKQAAYYEGREARRIEDARIDERAKTIKEVLETIRALPKQFNHEQKAEEILFIDIVQAIKKLEEEK